MVNRNGTAISWNSDNLPVSITQSGSNSSGFAYAPDKHRYYQTAEIAGVAETTVYVGGYEAVTSNGTTLYRHHLMADGREVAEVDLSNSGSSVTEKINYVLTDHLGSTDVVETTDENNNVLATQYMEFSTWGARREPGTWLPPVGSTETQADHAADRYGFTHQEMLDNVGIIHMNGRIYDPTLGRFLSVDPVFEFPTNTQSLNPYSYVLNNPLSMTDPTGYVPDSCGTGKTSCPDDSNPQSKSTTVHVSYTPTGSHIAISGTVTATALGNGSYAVTGSNTAVAQAFNSGAKAAFGNGVTTLQGAADAQTQPTQHTEIGSPSNTSIGCTQLMCGGEKITQNPYLSPKTLQTSNSQILATEANEAGRYGPAPFPYPDPKNSPINSVGYGYRLDSLAKVRLYESVRDRDGSLSASGADFLTRSFESGYVHSTIAREVHAEMTQGQYDAASDFVYQHGHLWSAFRTDINLHAYILAGFALYDPKNPGRTMRDVNEFLEATPENSRMIESLWPNKP